MAEIFLVTGNILPLYGAVNFTRPDGLIAKTVKNVLPLTQSVSVKINPLRLNTSNTLNLTAQARSTSKILAVSNVLELNDVVARRYFYSVFSFLNLSHVGKTVIHEIVSDTLTFSQLLGAARGVSQTITFTDDVTYNIIRVISVVQSVNFVQSVSIYKSNNPGFVFNPVAATPEYTPIILTIGSRVLTLSVPEFGDESRIEHHRIARETRAGDKIIYKDPIWPVGETLQLSFQDLSQTQASQLLQFVEDTLGQTVLLTDHFGIVWSGIIINPDLDVEQANSAACSGFETEIQFEGVRI